MARPEESGDLTAAQRALDDLRTELDRHGASLPSLSIEPVWGGTYLIHLGGARPDIITRLTIALRASPEP